MLLEREGVLKFPNILIVGEQRIENTDIEKLTKSEFLQDKIFYLSV